MGIAAFLGARYLIHRFVAVVEQYSETRPMTLPKDSMSAEEYQKLENRMTAFQDGLKNQNPVAPLILTGTDINALIAHDPGWRNLSGKVYVTIEGDQILGRVSLPLDEFSARLWGLSRLKGRYLNGTAGLKASLANGLLVVTLQTLEANGQRPPPQFMSQLQMINFAENVAKDPQSAATMGKLESITVKDGAITITPRPRN